MMPPYGRVAFRTIPALEMDQQVVVCLSGTGKGRGVGRCGAPAEFEFHQIGGAVAVGIRPGLAVGRGDVCETAHPDVIVWCLVHAHSFNLPDSAMVGYDGLNLPAGSQFPVTPRFCNERTADVARGK